MHTNSNMSKLQPAVHKAQFTKSKSMNISADQVRKALAILLKLRMDGKRIRYVCHCAPLECHTQLIADLVELVVEDKRAEYRALDSVRSCSDTCERELVDSAIVQRITLHSLRLWMAEMAYRAKIPRDRRRYIGQWAQEATSDVYTREHRHVCTGSHRQNARITPGHTAGGKAYRP